MLKVIFSLHQLCQLHSGSQKSPILYKVFSDNGFYFHRLKSMLVMCSDDPQANGVYYTREVVEFKLARTNWISCQNPSQCVQGAHTQQSLWEKGSHLGYLGSYVLRWSKGLYAQFTPSESARLTHNQRRTKSERRGWNKHSFSCSFWVSFQSRLGNLPTWMSWRPFSYFFLHLPSLTNPPRVIASSPLCWRLTAPLFHTVSSCLLTHCRSVSHRHPRNQPWQARFGLTGIVSSISAVSLI